MLMSKDIEEVARACKSGEEMTFIITKENKLSLFAFCFYQFKYRTLKEFKTISYQKEKDLLYWFLKAVAIISFGKYKITYDF